MQKEICLYYQPVYSREVMESAFLCEEHDLSGIGVTPDMLTKVKSIISKERRLSCCIDFPGGLSFCDVKIHSIISCIRRGANCIDFVVNPSHIANSSDLSKMQEEVSSAYSLCQERNVVFRPMIDYRYYRNEKILKIFNTLKNIGVDFCFISTGMLSDDITDHSAISRYVSDFCQINVIYNGKLWSNEQYQKILETGIYGVAFKSLISYKSTFGVL
jgi:deoxyribose-phosphate aldolase